MRRAVLVLALLGCKARSTEAPLCTNAVACQSLGHELEEHDDRKGARAAYTRGCELDDALSCFHLSHLHDDPALSHGATESACRLGFSDACAEAGANFTTGNGTAKNLTQAIAALERACTGNSGLGCYHLGVVYRDGVGIAANPETAYARFARACTLEHGTACHDQGIALMLGRGVPADRAAATTAFDKACSISARECFGLALVSQEAGDLARARTLYDKACGAGSTPACANLASLQRLDENRPKIPIAPGGK